jgi:hypothetical protein
LLVLIADIEKDANEGKWEEVDQKLTLIKDYCSRYPQWITEPITTKIKHLETRLLAFKTRQTQITLYQVIVGCTTISLLTLGLIFLITKILVKRIINIVYGK